jgi:hypothetical protein
MKRRKATKKGLSLQRQQNTNMKEMKGGEPLMTYGWILTEDDFTVYHVNIVIDEDDYSGQDLGSDQSKKCCPWVKKATVTPWRACGEVALEDQGKQLWMMYGMKKKETTNK